MESRELAYIFGNFGRSLINLKNLGSKGKYFQGAEEFSFRDLGRSMRYFQGSREHRSPWGPLLYKLKIVSVLCINR